tara:strand:- start:1506 stop:2069 length:564 start_codon:yes stop_codon:yes gene_type:complete
MKHIAIFASGNGSTTENIIKYFKDNINIKVSIVLSNRIEAKVLSRAKNYKIDTYCFTKTQLNKGAVTTVLKKSGVCLIVLAGFLLKIPKSIIMSYNNKIINIHPSLLPLYGGKGMYGRRVHEAVYKSKDRYTGMTIHFVNEEYDEGDIIFQAKSKLPQRTTIKFIEKQVRQLELKFLPIIIEKLLNE